LILFYEFHRNVKTLLGSTYDFEQSAVWLDDVWGSGGDTAPAFLNTSKHKNGRFFSSWCLSSRNAMTSVGRCIRKGSFEDKDEYGALVE
jgi:hypothetical protein